MTRQQALKAILTGMELAADTEADVLGIGEMGIGNTTTSSAILSVLLDADIEAVTGRGGGITDASFLKKKWASAIPHEKSITSHNGHEVMSFICCNFK